MDYDGILWFMHMDTIDILLMQLWVWWSWDFMICYVCTTLDYVTDMCGAGCVWLGEIYTTWCSNIFMMWVLCGVCACDAFIYLWIWCIWCDGFLDDVIVECHFYMRQQLGIWMKKFPSWKNDKINVKVPFRLGLNHLDSSIEDKCEIVHEEAFIGSILGSCKK